MEVLKYPHSECSSYVQYQTIALGPLNNMCKQVYEMIPIGVTDSFMQEAKGIYGENYVTHFKGVSELTYSPMVVDIVDRPTGEFPDRVMIPSYWNGQLREVNAPLGYSELSDYAVQNPIGNYGFLTRHYAIQQNGYGFWTITVIVAGGTPKYLSSALQYEVIGMTPSSPGTVTVLSIDRLQQGRTITKSLHQRLTCKDVLEIAGKFSGGTNRSTSCNLFQSRNTDWLTPAQVRDLVRANHDNAFMGYTYLPEKHFGDLANAAAEKMNANNTNMLEFLSDMRKLDKMIPKLTNLKKLKTHADNFLMVNYGLLPTTQDLARIVKAFQKKKISFDKDGRTLQNASHRASIQKEETLYELEQHIKISIGKEDVGILQLIAQMDSIGVFPTFEKVWDLVPFSFVLDWFVDVGSFLKRVDGVQRLLRLDIFYSTMSVKRSATTTLRCSRSLPVSGSIKRVHYRRWVQVRTPLPPLSLQLNSNGASHWLEATALIVQRTKL